jgi:hypothetical protein
MLYWLSKHIFFDKLPPGIDILFHENNASRFIN